jgi:hypothetical protein
MPWTPGPREPNSRFRRWFRGVSIGDDGTAPVRAPLKIKPTAAPTATSEAGDIYFNSTSNLLLASNGTSYAPIGGNRVVKNAATTLTAADSGAVCVWGAAAGYLYTLPTAQAGLSFDFVVAVTISSSAAKVITASTSEFILGSFLQIPDTAAQIVARNADGSTIRAWSGNGSTTGGWAGDSFRLTAISATQWVISGIGLATGTEATPFATS